MRHEIPLEEFTVSVHPEGIYQKCRNCGKETRVDTKEGVAKLTYCPECGFDINKKPKTAESQLKAVKKYKEKVKRITIDFSPAEEQLWQHIQNQPKKQTYIKDLIRKDMNKGEA